MFDFFILYYRAFLDILLIWVLAVIMPGPDMFLVMTSSIQRSKAYALMAGFGIVVGTLVWLLVGFFLVGILAQTSFFEWIQIIGGGYLVWMASKVFLSLRNRQKGELESVELQSSAWKGFAYGVLTNLSNPKPPIFISIILSNLPKATPLFEQSVLLIVMLVIPAIWFSSIVFVFRLKRVLNLFLQYSHWLDMLAILVFGIFGINLVSDGIGKIIGE